jgi:hypothetical protein
MVAKMFDIWTQICPDIGIFRLSGIRTSDGDCTGQCGIRMVIFQTVCVQFLNDFDHPIYGPAYKWQD